MQMLGKTPHDSKTKGVHQQASAKGARSSWEQEVTGDCLLPHPMPQTRLEVFQNSMGGREQNLSPWEGTSSVDALVWDS